TLLAIRYPIATGKRTPEAAMAGWRQVTEAGPVPRPVGGKAAGMAIVRGIATTALTIAAVVPSWACASDRYALGPGRVVRSGDNMPVFATIRSAKGHTLHGGIGRGEPDSIFADGFDLNASYDVAFTDDVPLGDAAVELGSVAVPAG